MNLIYKVVRGFGDRKGKKSNEIVNYDIRRRVYENQQDIEKCPRLI